MHSLCLRLRKRSRSKLKELEYLKIINNTLEDSSLLGDDCACLNDLQYTGGGQTCTGGQDGSVISSGSSIHGGRNLCVTHDTLVEGVHFLLETTKAFELGQKAVNVNLSDLAAAGAEPLYLTISLSLPSSSGGDCSVTDAAELSGAVDYTKFVKEFYKGVQAAIDRCFAESGAKVKVAGGDLTASEKVCVSVCAIGAKYNDIRVGRDCAKTGDIVAVTGFHGDSAGGLRLLMQSGKKSKEPPGAKYTAQYIAQDKNLQSVPEPDPKKQESGSHPQEPAGMRYLTQKHLVPLPQNHKSAIIMQAAKDAGAQSIAMMDSSDGLFDALYKLSAACGKVFDIDYDAIPVSSELKQTFPHEWRELACWGGEDFELVFCVSQKIFERLDSSIFYRIGTVSDKQFEASEPLYKKDFEGKSYKHF